MELPITASFLKARGSSVGTTAISGIPLYIFAVTLASLCTIVGVMWDISWHITVGRDKFFSPPHIVFYTGAVMAGLFSGIQVLWQSFSAPYKTKQSLIKIWGIFYSSSGALFCIWGAIAMLTSAPFDNWWHSAYGLDIVILSPPHVLLGAGILMLQFGACVCTSKYLNQTTARGPSNNAKKQQALLRVLFIIATASFLAGISMWATEYVYKRVQRSAMFYEVAAVIYLLFLPAFARQLRMRYGMTAITTASFFIAALTNWIMEAVPAVPRLGPVLNHVTHFQSLPFPLLLSVPAFVIDWIMQRPSLNDWKKAMGISIVFVLLLLIIQYPLSGFLLQSPDARNWFFSSDAWPYSSPPDWEFRYAWQPGEESTLPELFIGLLIAIGMGIFISRLSLRWGKWFQKIQR